jgi:S1-C subfamily serine protease
MPSRHSFQKAQNMLKKHSDTFSVKRIKKAVVLLAVILFFGWAPPKGWAAGQFSMNGVSYPSAEAAELALQTDIQRVIDATPVSPIHVPGSLLIVLPTRAALQDAVQKLFSVPPGDSAGTRFVQIFVTSLEIILLGTVETIKAGKIFDQVEAVRTAEVENYPSDKYDYKIRVTEIHTGKPKIYLSKTGRSQVELQQIFEALSPGENKGAKMNAVIALAATRLAEGIATSGDQASNQQATAKSYGSAFFVNDQGMALTNQHVVGNCASVYARLRSGELATVSVLATDRENDLALLKVATSNKEFAQLRIGLPRIRQGEQVIVYGYPLPGGLASQGVFTTGTVSALAGLRDNTRELQISAPAQPGNSGGPLLDQSGNVIGVVSSVLDAMKTAKNIGSLPQNVNFAIKATMLSGFLEANDTDFSTKISSKILSSEDVGDKAKSFTFRVECQKGYVKNRG